MKREADINRKMSVLVTGAELVAVAIEKLEAFGASLTLMDGKVTEARLREAITQVQPDAILMRGNPPLGRAMLEFAPQLRVIAKHGAGVDSVDLTAATERGILVMVAGDANAPAVAEHTMAMILALGRDLVSLDRGVHNGVWARNDYKGREVAGRTLGLVGFGRVARRVASMAACFGLKVLALPRRAGTVDPALAREVGSLDDLLRQSDIVSLHTPLTDLTRNMIDAAALSLMRPGALLINTGRGALIDEAALADVLTSGRLAGAAVDTLVEEPPDADAPLLHAPNLLITPHIAAMTGASIARMGLGAAENIVAALTGTGIDPANVANPAVLSLAR